MDVIEDVIEVLRVVLDYVGIDMEDVSEFLGSLNMRSRRAIVNLNRSIVHGWQRSITEPRLRISTRWRHWRSDIRHRSLVRIIGTRLPLAPAKRLKIHSYMLRHGQRRDSCDSNMSLFSLTSTVSSTDMVWVEEDLGDNCIRVSAQKKDDVDDCDTSDDFDNECILRNEGVRSPMNSTMISSISMMSSCDVQKISSMEDELAALRNQMAMLVLMQEQVNKSQAVPSSFCATPTDNNATPISNPAGSHGEMFSPPLPPPPPSLCEPLPPDSLGEGLPPYYSMPPPPAPCTPQWCDPLAISTPCVIQHQVLANTDQDKEDTSSGAPSLTDVLKGLSSVKLRSVQRSPGGTPVRGKRPPLPSNTLDPATLIAQALKRKFAQQMTYSPDTDKENDNHDFSSPDVENSPHIIPGRARKSKRRSLLFDDRRKSVGPLCDLNV